jgi:hypothetical protein
MADSNISLFLRLFIPFAFTFQAGHLLPMFNAKEKLKSGKIKQEDIPYMQRGGSWDNTDVKGAKRKAWSASDMQYKQNTTPAKFDWSGGMARTGPSSSSSSTATTQTKKKQMTKTRQQQGSEKNDTPKKNKLFGLF